MTSGAYSSIFIAAPLLTIWKEREPEFAKRKAMAPTEELVTAGGGRRGRGQLDPQAALIEESEQALAAEPTPDFLDTLAGAVPEPPVAPDARREKRRQRRRTRPHGRAR